MGWGSRERQFKGGVEGKERISMPCLCNHIDRGDYDEWVYILGFKGRAI
jgi:hypothetical protein